MVSGAGKKSAHCRSTKARPGVWRIPAILVSNYLNPLGRVFDTPDQLALVQFSPPATSRLIGQVKMLLDRSVAISVIYLQFPGMI
jgi:hypothetical protein